MKQASLCLLMVCFAAQAQTPALVDYTAQVHPILAAKCLSCHSDEKRAGGLSLATYPNVIAGGRSGAAVKPGSSPNSLLIRRIDGETQPSMPLAAAPLSAGEIALMRNWIDQGARATPTSAAAKPRWEAPLELAAPPLPQVTWSAWSAPLDRVVSQYLARHHVPEPKPVSDAVFARRVYLDTQGLLAPPDQLRAFIKDTAAAKRASLVRTLLSDNRNYAENWVTFWNDLLRNDEGVNYAGSRKSISDWLLPALTSNLRYDQFVARLLNPAADSDPSGFLVGVNWRGDISASQTPAMQAAQNSAQIFLGVNLKCNSCHDSFISKWKLKDAYSLASYFADDAKLQMFRCDSATGQYAVPGFLFPELNRPAASDSLADRHAAVAAIFTDRRNGRLARTVVNRIWQRLFGRGIVENPDEMDAEPWSPEVLDWLASDFVAHAYDLKYLISTILSSRTYQMLAVSLTAEPRDYVFRGPEIRRLSAEQFADAIGSITGEWRVFQPQTAATGVYTREWHVASTPLTRALGRPIRDQVVSIRNNDATTLQALELVNGDALTHWLQRGARKMLGTLPPEPTSLFDSGLVRSPGRDKEIKPVAFDIEIGSASKLWLLVQDVDSYSPDKVEAVWLNAELVGSNGQVAKLQELSPVDGSGLRSAAEPVDGLRVATPSQLVFDLAGRQFTRFRGSVSLEKGCFRDDINPRVRFFVFQEQPNMERLVTVKPDLPVPAMERARSNRELIDRVFWYALNRAPNANERLAAEAALAGPANPGHVSADALADLLWAILMKPEFQLII